VRVHRVLPQPECAGGVRLQYGVTLGLIEEGESVSNKDWRAVGKKGGNGGTSSGGNDVGHPCEMTKGEEYK